jgi:hypothetical protein
VISGFRCDVNEIFDLLGRYTALIVVLKCQEWFGARRRFYGLLYDAVSTSTYDDKVFLSSPPQR